jgi:hypothetical protein
LIAACDPEGEFAHDGIISGRLILGHRRLTQGSVEMVELSGPQSERCGPHDCGMAVAALNAGIPWNPGTWRLIAPKVPGWTRPEPTTVVIHEGKTTVVNLSYSRSR